MGKQVQSVVLFLCAGGFFSVLQARMSKSQKQLQEMPKQGHYSNPKLSIVFVLQFALGELLMLFCMVIRVFWVVQGTLKTGKHLVSSETFLRSKQQKVSLKFVHLCNHNKRQFFTSWARFVVFIDAVVYRRDLNCFLKKVEETHFVSKVINISMERQHRIKFFVSLHL